MRKNISSITVLVVLALSLVCLFLVSCDPAGRSASKAFDNANSVIKSGSDKLFIETTPTPTPIL